MPRWIVDPTASEQLSYAGVRPSPTAPNDPSVAVGRDNFDVLHYAITLTPDFTTEFLDGHVQIQFRPLIDGLQFIDLDLFSDFTVNGVDQGSSALTYQHLDDVLRIHFDEAPALGATTNVVVSYSGTPLPSGFMGFDFAQTPSGNPILATISEPYFARSWWPCKDTPSDKALVSINVLAPTGMYAASNGNLVAQNPTSTGTWYSWVETYPMTTYNVSIAVAEYVSWTENYTSPGGQDFPLEFHVFPEHETVGRYEFERTAQILDFFHDKFGEYPFHNEKYGMAEFVYVGAMEHQTMTSYGDFFFTGDRFYEFIIAHEVSHHWWGNSLTAESWEDVWLHEGLATFSSALWIEESKGVGEYRSYLRRHSNACCGFPGTIVSPESNFNQTVYDKGAWLLHMLREYLGDTAFFSALRDFAARVDLQYGVVKTQDFVDQFEASTQMDLSWFFDQWLYREGRPTFYVDWSTQPEGAWHRFDLEVVQTESMAPWTFPLELLVVTTAGNLEMTIPVTQQTVPLTGFAAGEVLNVIVDPNKALLHYLEDAPTPTAAPSSRGVTTQILPNYPNPFNPRTTLRFELAESAAIRLAIYDARGRRVRNFDLGRLDAGEHDHVWDGLDDSGAAVSSGVYHVRMEGIPGIKPTRAITLIR